MRKMELVHGRPARDANASHNCEIHIQGLKDSTERCVMLDFGDSEPSESVWDEEHLLATTMLTDVLAAVVFCAARAGAHGLDDLMQATEALYRAVMS